MDDVSSFDVFFAARFPECVVLRLRFVCRGVDFGEFWADFEGSGHAPGLPVALPAWS